MKQVVIQPDLCDIVARADKFAKGSNPPAVLPTKVDQKPAAQKEKYCELSGRALKYAENLFSSNHFEDHAIMDCDYYGGFKDSVEALRNSLHAKLDTTIDKFIEDECNALTLYQNLKNARIVMAVECNE